MKLLLVGNHTCGNRGDAAILRGLLNCLRQIDNKIEIDVISRYSISSSYLLNEIVGQDILYSKGHANKPGFYAKVKAKIHNYIMPKILMAHYKNEGVLKYKKLPPHIIEFTNKVRDYDAVIQVGGSFFVDLYGPAQFEHIFCSLLAKKPIYLVGHSVGPFKNSDFKRIAMFAFKYCNELILRENVSKQLLVSDNFQMDNVTDGVDTAFLVDNNVTSDNDYIIDHWNAIISHNKTVALTVRKLAPFDKRLGVTQEEYELAIAGIIEHILSLGYQVVIFSTCTGIESYNNDDRIVALSVKNKVKNTESVHVVMDEINDIQLGILLSKCSFTIGTRLHSAIISMNFGTPAIAINYEHKSKGIMNSLNVDNLSIDVKNLFDNVIIERINYLHNNRNEVKNKIEHGVSKVKNDGRLMLENIINKIGVK
ncbi:TPA: colanic acid biosynthesis pyruvyl transferase WcaK [Klebsiella pneumoniae]|uniref:colanic acid biosynthesis pyruvyl transferase WcaK n=1 Tax=Klebsiella pneumoniae TaxID=573 RepID=UPI00109D2E44|nr:colanic acid biosynthesis pyruvyl transferase WcaK [Klebsiella pneumoniae]EIX9529922.1 colanic acid biosynthesis pyruvyl transferase WcaK [Klebsiella pneumoniae]EKZ5543385.1 colanic acid biosynthesis pyruvyl transferase WcaK [Klebsiella pneumoniae]MCE0417848.1 colanic acid biosynthesis pyruvyl transferase WcaK [Klebsiella pneumoniae]MCM5869351.1 colanic acid biosynthesis pyruvyl transferase WcaK [Klebsiella pneumoniae]MCU8606263.1 colanic acid biosynthesis pyruvyl transferase WcaK [Klebsiel